MAKRVAKKRTTKRKAFTGGEIVRTTALKYGGSVRGSYDYGAPDSYVIEKGVLNATASCGETIPVCAEDEVLDLARGLAGLVGHDAVFTKQ